MVFPTIYTDNTGSITTHFETDGECMQLMLRNTAFTGANFDELSLVNETDHIGDGITLDHLGCITNCIFDISIPVRIGTQQVEKMASLSFRLHLESGKITWYDQLSFRIDEHTTLHYPDKKGEFIMESILPYLKKELPDNVTLLCCFDCAFAHYWPAGNSAFGGMRCYKNLQPQVLQIADKGDLMDLDLFHGDLVLATQETWHCNEFQFPAPDQWRYI